MASATDPLADAIAKRVAEILSDTRVVKRVYNLQEAAEYLGCSEESVRNHLAAGDLKAVRYDRFLRFDLKDLDRFVDHWKR